MPNIDKHVECIFILHLMLMINDVKNVISRRLTLPRGAAKSYKLHQMK